MIVSESRKMRALVVEDEWPARNYLVEILQDSGLAEVVAAVASQKEARQVLDAGGLAVDVAFIDINLSGGRKDAGLALAREFVGRSGSPLFVLATALKQHALEAFDLGAVDYILKPFNEERVKQCLLRLKERLPRPFCSPTSERVVARSKKGLVFLHTDEVLAFEASGRLTFVHSDLGLFDVDLSLSAIESSFPTRILRVHRQWLINLAHVRAIDSEQGDMTVLVGGDLSDQKSGIRIPVSRERRQQVRELLLAGATGIRRS